VFPVRFLQYIPAYTLQRPVPLGTTQRSGREAPKSRPRSWCNNRSQTPLRMARSRCRQALACRQRLHSFNLTKLDVLDDFDEIKVATSYSHNGQQLESFPANPEILTQLEVHYETLPGWKKPTTGAKSYYDLPVEARKYVEFIEEFTKVKVKWIGVGPAREHMIAR
jgi:hypothetical protein